MLDFVFILAIFFEITLSAICIVKIANLEKRVLELNQKIILAGNIALEANKKLKITIEKLNKVVSIVTNKNFLKAKKILKISLDIIQIIILLRSLDFSKGLKSVNFKNIKKLMLTEVSRRILRHLLCFKNT